MKTPSARYEVGVEDEVLDYYRKWHAASIRAKQVKGYVYDRMAHIGKPELWQVVDGILVIKAVRMSKEQEIK